jgi:hypothetical protein
MMWSRASAGVVAGFFLAAAVLGLASLLLPGPWQAAIVPGLLAFVPLWLGFIGAAFAFANGRRAWTWLRGLALACSAALWALRMSAWVQ